MPVLGWDSPRGRIFRHTIYLRAAFQATLVTRGLDAADEGELVLTCQECHHCQHDTCIPGPVAPLRRSRCPQNCSAEDSLGTGSACIQLPGA